MTGTDDERLTQLLFTEHELILRALTVLEGLARQVRGGAPLEPAAARRLLDFFADYADRHHHAKEEDVLFPWMTARGFPSQGGPLVVMLEEHREGRSCVQAMNEALGGSAPDAGARFAAVAERYVDLLRSHIEKENHILFPMADSLGEGTAGIYTPSPAELQAAGDLERDAQALVAELEAVARAGQPAAG